MTEQHIEKLQEIVRDLRHHRLSRERIAKKVEELIKENAP